MSEATQMWQLTAALVLMTGFVWLYVRGGRSDRILRWLAGGIWFAIGGNLLAWWVRVWSAWMLSALLAYPAALTFGYGVEGTAAKLRKRAVCGALMGLASGAFLLPIGNWQIWIGQIMLSVSGSVYYGVKNPMSAVGEEGQIALCYVCLTPFALI